MPQIPGQSKERLEMNPQNPKEKVDQQPATQPDQAFDKNLRPPEDDAGQQYLLGRQLAHELHAPGIQELLNSPVDPTGDFISTARESVKSDKTEKELAKPDVNGKEWVEKQYQAQDPGSFDKLNMEEIAKEIQGLEEPYLDPTAAAAGGFGGMGAVSLRQGMKLLPSLGRALLSGAVGGVMDYPIGAYTEEVIEPDMPVLAMPFNVLTGMVSGITLEAAIEKGVIRGLSNIGMDTKKAPDMVKRIVDDMKVKLKDESGALDLTKEPQKSVIKQLNEDFKDINPVLEDLTPSREPIGTPKAKKILVAIGAKPETSGKVEKAGTLTSISKQLYFPPDAEEMELPGKAININFSRIESEEEVKRVINRVSEIYRDEIQTARRGVRTNVQTQHTANLLGMTPEELLSRRKGQAFNAEEALAARRVLVSSSENVWNLAQKVQTLDATDTDRFEFRKALNLHYAIQSQVSGMTAEAGRALQSFNITATSAVSKTRQIKELLGTLPSGISINQMAEAIAGMDSIEGISRAIPKMLRATTKDMFLEAWINGLLSGPQTHAINTISNALNAVWQIPERLLASEIGRVFPAERAIQEGEALSQAYGLIEGFKDGMKAFSRVVTTGVPSDQFSKIEIARYRSITAQNVRQLPLIKKMSPNALQEGGMGARAVDLVGDVVRTPGRFLMAEDEFFKSIGYRMELRAQAYRAAAEEGLTGPAAGQRIQQILSDPEKYAPNIHLASIDAARYATFTNPLESPLLSALSRSNNPVIRLIVPFVRTPTNILKYGFERTPLAFLSQKIRADIGAGGARRDLTLARISLGSMLMATTATLASEGYITGGGPSDPKLRSNLKRQGWQPYSLKIGDTYVQFGRLEPLGTLLGMAADMSEITGLAGEELAPETDNLASAIVMAVSRNVTSKTWLRGLSEAIQAMEDPDRYGNRYIQNYARTLIPTGIAQVERAIDPEQEAVYSMVDALKSRVPYLSNELPPRRDQWGKPETFQYGEGKRSWGETAFSLMSPIYISKGKDSPIDKELTRLKVGLTHERKNQAIAGVDIELTPQEFDEFQVLMNETKADQLSLRKISGDLTNVSRGTLQGALAAPEVQINLAKSLKSMGGELTSGFRQLSQFGVTGMNLKDTLDTLVSKPKYKDLRDEQKGELIKNIIRFFRTIGRIKLIEKYPELLQLARDWEVEIAIGGK